MLAMQQIFTRVGACARSMRHGLIGYPLCQFASREMERSAEFVNDACADGGRAQLCSHASSLIGGSQSLSSRCVLGISAYYHDSAAALLREGEIVAAAQEERFTRKKGDDAFPRLAVEYCLREAGATMDDIVSVVFYDKPLLKFERILE